MNFVKRKNLTEREEILFVPRLHLMFVLKHIIWFTIFISGYNISWFRFVPDFIFPIDYLLYTNLILCVLFSFKLVCHIYIYLNIEYGVTNRRFMIKKGIFEIDTKEITLDKVESVNCHQKFFGMLFNYGNVIVNGIGCGKLNFYMVRKPYSFRRKVVEYLEKSKAISVFHGEIPKHPVREPSPPIDDTCSWGPTVLVHK